MSGSSLMTGFTTAGMRKDTLASANSAGTSLFFQFFMRRPHYEMVRLMSYRPAETRGGRQIRVLRGWGVLLGRRSIHGKKGEGPHNLLSIATRAKHCSKSRSMFPAITIAGCSRQHSKVLLPGTSGTTKSSSVERRGRAQATTAGPNEPPAFRKACTWAVSEIGGTCASFDVRKSLR